MIRELFHQLEVFLLVERIGPTGVQKKVRRTI